MEKILTILCMLFSFAHLHSQEQDQKFYNLNWKYDAPILSAGVLGTATGFYLISQQDGISKEQLASLQKSDVNRFDRFSAGNFSLTAERNSDFVFYGAFPYGLVLLLDKKVRKEAGTIGVMYLEAISLTSMNYSLAAGFTNRFRPYTYRKNDLDNEELLEDRRSLHARNSFYAGHPSIVAVSTVFTAKVFSDMNPDSPYRAVMWGIAGISTLSTAYWRLKAGKHFTSDLIVGVTVSSAIGYLVPHLHKNKNRKESALRIMPYTGESTGLNLTYTFKNKTKPIKKFNLD